MLSGRWSFSPSHRSYLDFVLCSYLIFTRADLGIRIPHIAAADDFARIPVLGRLFRHLGAFYVKRGVGRVEEELTRRVHDLAQARQALLFFVEGGRSRSRHFLPPKRGLLRCLQATGQEFALLPVSLTYDCRPEEAALLDELRGHPRPKMRLLPLLAWTARVFRGRVDIGRVHVACGEPILYPPTRDVVAASHEVIARLQGAMAVSTLHLRAFLRFADIRSVDLRWLRGELERRGAHIIVSSLPVADIPALAERCMRNEWSHYFYREARTVYAGHPAVESECRRHAHAKHTSRPPAVDLSDPRLQEVLHALFDSVCRDYQLVANSLGHPGEPLGEVSPAAILRRSTGAYLPTLEGAFDDLVAREILPRHESGDLAWGPRSDDLARYRVSCCPLSQERVRAAAVG